MKQLNVYNNILEAIGRTPLVKLNKVTQGMKASVYAKMESLNPGGSVKDRPGFAMIESAEKNGELKPGGTVIEATSGNMGIGLALTCAVKGYKSLFVTTDKASIEKVRYLKALGAEVVIVSSTAKPHTPDYYVDTAVRMAKEIPNAIFIGQYDNPANPEVHYRTTGPEIWEQTEGKITHFVGGLGTGGTTSGVGRFLKEKNSSIKVIAGDPYGSIFKDYKETGVIGEGTPYNVEGIGQDRLPQNVHFQYIDDIILVSDKEAFDMSRRLGREEGIFCGGSSGLIAYAALKVAKELNENAIVVFVVCDTGERALSKHHSDEWMREKGFM